MMISNTRWTQTILPSSASLKQKFAWLQGNCLCSAQPLWIFFSEMRLTQLTTFFLWSLLPKASTESLEYSSLFSFSGSPSLILLPAAQDYSAQNPHSLLSAKISFRILTDAPLLHLTHSLSKETARQKPFPLHGLRYLSLTNPMQNIPLLFGRPLSLNGKGLHYPAKRQNLRMSSKWWERREKKKKKRRINSNKKTKR